MRKIILFLILTVVSILPGCSTNPKMNDLREGVNFICTLVRSREVDSLVRKVDAGMKPSTAAEFVLSSEIINAAPPPPKGIAIFPRSPQKPWCVVVKADDTKKVVIVEGYGEKLDKPIITENIRFPYR